MNKAETPAGDSVRTILFLCTGNFYRSRFAEYLFNVRASTAGLPWQALSRGIQAWRSDGEGPISQHTRTELQKRDICIADVVRQPMQLTTTDLHSAHVVIAVKEAEHRRMLHTDFPDWSDRVEYWSVDDLDCADPVQAMRSCEAFVNSLLQRLSECPGKLP